jgi:hypothetical protein
VAWSRRGYDTAALEQIYTGNDARVNLVLHQLAEKLADPAKMRALGFCVSIAHAEFMADRFSRAGLPSEAISARTDSETRSASLRRLERGDVRALFAVDIFNEGVDLPSVDTLLFLRPTESPVVFMQQLGRGLRRSVDKACVTVLDFIGQPNRRFRFDLRYRAITGASRTQVEKQIEAGFPVLPAGCTMQLDRVAQQVVLANLRGAISTNRNRLRDELALLATSTQFSTRAPTLEEFLKETNLELEDVYRNGSWSGLKRAAGLEQRTMGPHEKAIADRISRILHVDDDLRLSGYRQALGLLPGDPQASIVEGLYFALLREEVEARGLDGIVEAFARHPVVVDELSEVLALLDKRTVHVTYPLDAEMGWKHQVPLSVHARHSTDDILTAFGLLARDRPAFTQKGVFRDERTNSDFFLVTLEKAERDYSPSTLYNDYAISPTHFHWQSQSIDTQAGAAGQRYLQHVGRRGHIFLFVRHRRRNGQRAAPYTFLGPARYVSHHGERPINFVWELNRPMPADFFKEVRVVGG